MQLSCYFVGFRFDQPHHTCFRVISLLCVLNKEATVRFFYFALVNVWTMLCFKLVECFNVYFTNNINNLRCLNIVDTRWVAPRIGLLFLESSYVNDASP